jgi:hypothetical protein
MSVVKESAPAAPSAASTTTVAAKSTKPRHTLASQLEFHLNPARLRRWLDKLGLNSEEYPEIVKINEQLLLLAKKDGPVQPVPPPKRPKKDATAADIEAYNAAVAARKVQVEAWKNYEHPEYTKQALVHAFYKHALHLAELLRRQEQTQTVKDDIHATLELLQDRPVPFKAPKAADKKKAAEEKYEKYSKDFVAPGFSSLFKASKLNAAAPDPSVIDTYLNKLRQDYPVLVMLLRKDELSHQKIRFNEEGMIAFTLIGQQLVVSLASPAMVNATDDNKKIIQPDHIIENESVFESPFYPLFRNLPHFSALIDRHDRRVLHAEQTKVKRALLFQEARKKAKTSGHAYTKADSPDLSSLKTFEEEEVENGFAVKREVIPPPKKKGGPSPPARVEYFWKDIDDEERVAQDNTNFNFYVGNLCTDIKYKIFDDRVVADGIKISKKIKTFLTHVITDFLARIAPKIRILLEYSAVKTVDLSVVMTALKFMLSDNYNKRDGKIAWSHAHTELFDSVKTTVDNWKTLSKAGRDAVTGNQDGQEDGQDGQDDDDADLDVLGDEDDDDDEAEVPAPAPAPAAPVPSEAPSSSGASSKPKVQRRR